MIHRHGSPRPRLNIKTVFPGMGIPRLMIRRTQDRLIINVRIPILVRRHLYIETARGFTYILQSDLTGAGTTMRLPQCQWSNPEVYGWMHMWIEENWRCNDKNTTNLYTYLLRHIINCWYKVGIIYWGTSNYLWMASSTFWLPARWAFGFSGDHQQNLQCVLIYRCFVIHVWC